MALSEKIFKGSIGERYHDSRPWWPEELPRPAGAPEHRFHRSRRRRVCRPWLLRIRDSHPVHGSACCQRRALFEFPCHCDVLAYARCLLTGRNSHAVGHGRHCRMVERLSRLPWAGHTRGRDRSRKSCATTAYGAYAVGKWHLTNIANYGSAGPHDNWPLGRGFSRWYGFHGALTDQWNPELYQDNRPIHLLRAATIISAPTWLIMRSAIFATTRPLLRCGHFFLYLAFGACHFPHQVPREYIRSSIAVATIAAGTRCEPSVLRRQRELGIVPAGTAAGAAQSRRCAMAGCCTPDMRILSTRLQETYAGFLEHTDAQIGRLIEYLPFARDPR